MASEARKAQSVGRLPWIVRWTLLAAACSVAFFVAVVFVPEELLFDHRAALAGDADEERLNALVADIRKLHPKFGPNIVSVLDFQGSGADGGIDWQAAFNNALASVAAKGGGAVVVPKGVYQLNGPLILRNKTVLELESGSLLNFSADVRHYMPVVHTWYEGSEVMNFAPLVSARAAHDVGIRGQGVLEGNGIAPTWFTMAKQGKPASSKKLREMNKAEVPLEGRVFGAGSDLRPSFIEFFECKSVLVEGIEIRNAPMWSLHPVLSSGVIVQNVTIRSQGFNADGVDPEMCTDVLIDNCHFHTSDDGVAIKAGRDADGRRIAKPTRRVVVRGCSVHPNDPAKKYGEGARNGVAIGSEGSAGVHEVWISDCTFKGRSRGIFVKSNADRGGMYSDLHFRRIHAENIKSEAVRFSMDFGGRTRGAFPPTFRDINVSGLTCIGASKAMLIKGLPASPIQRLSVTGCSFSRCAGIQVLQAQDVSLEGECGAGAQWGPEQQGKPLLGCEGSRQRLPLLLPGFPSSSRGVRGDGRPKSWGLVCSQSSQRRERHALPDLCWRPRAASNRV